MLKEPIPTEQHSQESWDSQGVIPCDVPCSSRALMGTFGCWAVSVPQKLTGTALPAKLFRVSVARGRALPEIRMQDGAEFCLPGELLTYGPINAVIGKARDNIYLEKSVVGNKWQVGVSALLSPGPPTPNVTV